MTNLEPGESTDPSRTPSAGTPAPSAGEPLGWGSGHERWGPRPARAEESRPGVVPLRPMSFGEVLDGAFTLVQRYPAVFLGLTSVLVVALAAFDHLVALLGAQALRELIGPPHRVDRAALVSAGLAAGVVALAHWVASGVLTGIVMTVADRGVRGESIRLREAWVTVRPRVPRLLGLSFVLGICAGAVGLVATVAVGLLAVRSVVAGVAAAVVLVPAAVALGLFVGVRWSVAAPLLALGARAYRIREALGESWRLLRGRWLPTFGLLVVATLIASLVAGIVQYALTFLAAALSGLIGGDEVSGAVSAVLALLLGGAGSSLLQLTFMSAVTVLILTDARFRAGSGDQGTGVSRPGA